MSRLKFTRPAREDLHDIGDYIAKDNPAAALKFVDQLRERCISLAKHPGLGRKRDEIKSDLRSINEGEYVIFYRVAQSGIEIVRIVHSKRDLSKISIGKADHKNI